jgi:hypothetical protein
MFFADNLINIDHCFHSKLGGNSKNIYKSLNCGKGTNDSIKNINYNLKFVANYYELLPKNIITLYQTHSNKSFIFRNMLNQNQYLHDGIVSKKKNVILSILTADCAPILFYDNQKKIIGACHAGWKGALSGIIDNTIINMVRLGSIPSNIHCAIGPCIGPNSYTVRDDFYETFTLKNKKNTDFFKKIEKNQYLFSLKKFIIYKLKLFKIKDICSIDIDTFDEEDLCFSHRRSILKKENDYGRMISTIVIKE